MAVIVVVPSATPVITFPLTVAFVVSLDVYVIVPSLAPAEGEAATVIVLPTVTVDGDVVNDIVRLALAILILSYCASTLLWLLSPTSFQYVVYEPAFVPCGIVVLHV